MTPEDLAKFLTEDPDDFNAKVFLEAKCPECGHGKASNNPFKHGDEAWDCPELGCPNNKRYQESQYLTHRSKDPEENRTGYPAGDPRGNKNKNKKWRWDARAQQYVRRSLDPGDPLGPNDPDD